MKDMYRSKVWQADRATVAKLQLPALDEGEIDDLVTRVEKSRWTRTKNPLLRKRKFKVDFGNRRWALRCWGPSYSRPLFLQFRPRPAKPRVGQEYATELDVIHGIVHWLLPFTVAEHGPEFCLLIGVVGFTSFYQQRQIQGRNPTLTGTFHVKQSEFREGFLDRASSEKGALGRALHPDSAPLPRQGRRQGARGGTARREVQDEGRIRTGTSQGAAPSAGPRDPTNA